MTDANPRPLSQGSHRLVHPVTSTTPAEFAASPVRKLRRQSLPARLCPPRQIEFKGRGDSGDPYRRQISAAAHGVKIGKGTPSPSVLGHLTAVQKAFYSRLEKVMVVTSHLVNLCGLHQRQKLVTAMRCKDLKTVRDCEIFFCVLKSSEAKVQCNSEIREEDKSTLCRVRSV